MNLKRAVSGRYKSLERPDFCGSKAHSAGSEKLTLGVQTVTAAAAAFLQGLQRNAAHFALASTANCGI